MTDEVKIDFVGDDQGLSEMTDKWNNISTEIDKSLKRIQFDKANKQIDAYFAKLDEAKVKTKEFGDGLQEQWDRIDAEARQRQLKFRQELQRTSDAAEESFLQFQSVVDDWDFEDMRWERSFTGTTQKIIDGASKIMKHPFFKAGVVTGILTAGGIAFKKWFDNSESVDDLKNAFDRLFTALSRGFEIVEPLLDNFTSKLNAALDLIEKLQSEGGGDGGEGPGFLFALGHTFNEMLDLLGIGDGTALEKSKDNLFGPKIPNVNKGQGPLNRPILDFFGNVRKDKKGNALLAGDDGAFLNFSRKLGDTIGFLNKQFSDFHDRNFWGLLARRMLNNAEELHKEAALRKRVKDSLENALDSAINLPEQFADSLLGLGTKLAFEGSLLPLRLKALQTGSGDKGFQSSIESVQGLVNRIQTSAASTDSKEDTQKKIAENAAKTVDAVKNVVDAIGTVGRQVGEALATNPLLAVLGP